MAIRQTRIFVPNTVPYDNATWAETLLGRVIRPLVHQHPIEWYWFSRYDQSLEGDWGDCDKRKVLEARHRLEWNGHFRSLRLRFRLSDADVQAFEQDGAQSIEDEGCVISDWRDFDPVAHLGGDRFVGEDRDARRRRERAKLVVSFLDAVSKLVLHSLIGPDAEGRFRIESNDDRQQNPLGSSFESIHHLFCNITGVPLRVLVFSDGSQTFVGTDWYSPQQAGWRVIQDIRIRY